MCKNQYLYLELMELYAFVMVEGEIMAILKLKYDSGFTHIVQAKNGKMIRLQACNSEELNLNDFDKEKDIYYTPNTFNSPIKRDKEHLWQLNSFYIDIDHKKGTRPIDVYEVVCAIIQLVENKKIPEPTEFVNSGRGIHVYWSIENCHIMLLDLWEKIEQYLLQQFKTLEDSINNIKVDTRVTDPTRLLRLKGSTNSRSNTLCYSMQKKEENIYNILDLKKQYIKSKNKKKKREYKELIFLPTKNLYTLNSSRVQDFKEIVRLRHGNVVGYRNTLIMLYSYHYRLFNDITVNELIGEVKSFNKSFNKPYNTKQLISVCRSVNKTVKHFIEDNTKGYKFSNSYIIEALELSEQEQSKMITIISKEEKYKRNNNSRTQRNEEGLTQKQQELKELKEKIVELKQQGLSNRAIAKELNCSEGKIRSILKK